MLDWHKYITDKESYGDYLLRKGIINAKQLKDARKIQEMDGGLISIILKRMRVLDDTLLYNTLQARNFLLANLALFYAFLTSLVYITGASVLSGRYYPELPVAFVTLIIAYFFRQKKSDSYFSVYLFSSLTLIFVALSIRVSEDFLKAHFFLLIIPGILLIYKKSSVFIFTGVVTILYFGTSVLFAKYLGTQNWTRLTVEETYSLLFGVFLQSIILWIIAKYFKNEWLARLQLTYDVKAKEEELRRERLKFGIQDISQIMYLYTIAEGVNKTTEGISHGSSVMEDRWQEQLKQVQSIEASTWKMRDFFKEMDGQISENADQAAKAMGLAKVGQENMEKIGLFLKETVGIIQSNTEMFHNIGKISKMITQLSEDIQKISSKTSLLALNAAIEAARAGQEGLGFAVVAEEVGKLSEMTQKASKEITSAIQGMKAETEEAEKVSTNQLDSAREGYKMANQSSESLNVILDNVGNLANRTTKLRESSLIQREYVESLSDNTEKISAYLRENSTFLTEISKRIGELSLESENLYGIIKIFDLKEAIDAQNQIMLELVHEGVRRVKQEFERGMAQGEIALQDFFDRNYKQIPGSDPPRYNTKFDWFTDQYISPIQEELLARYNNVVFIAVIDENGYLPTHNKKFAHPLTGNYEVDLKFHRTKRIFNDRTGLSAAQNTEPFLLQTYKRDTGEFMNDLSVPIFLGDRHWGALRMGFFYDKKMLYEEDED